MKYIKLFMLVAVASLFAACSDDDDWNSNNDVTVSFESATVTVKESSGIVNVPIVIEGARNGNVKMQLSVKEVGTSPATADVNYLLTSPTLNLNCDTLESNTVNAEIKIVDDTELNDDRTFELTIASVEGAKLGAITTTTVTIRDNESLMYEQFFGTWTLTADSYRGSISKEVTISGETDETAANYDKLLTVTAPSFLNVGVALDLEWHMNYTFDKSAKTGTLSIVNGELIASYGSSYQWCWLTASGNEVGAEWELTSEDKLPTTITFESTEYLYFYQPNAGWWDRLWNIVLTKN